MSTILRISNICRVCLKEDKIMLLLFDKYATENPVESLRAAVHLEYSPNDELPNQICMECLKKAHECLAFQQQCIHSENLFQHFLRQQERNKLNSCFSDTSNTIATEIVPESIDTKAVNDHPIKIENDETEYKYILKNQEIESGSYMPDLADDVEVVRYSGNKSSENNLQCPICECEFSSNAKMEKHLQKHSNLSTTINIKPRRKHKPKTNFVCSKCGLRSLTSRKHKIHTRSHKNKGPPKRYPCDICNKTFANNSNVRIHQRIHNNEQRYKCSICDKPFVHWASCKAHEFIHSDALNHVCEICGKGYKVPSDLRRHFNDIHTDKKHPCDFCLKEFHSRRNLLAHTKIHSNNRAFHCDMCGKTFTRRTNLNTHLKIHTGEKPHVCYICDKGFLQKHVLRAHLKIHNVVVDHNTNVVGVVEEKCVDNT